MTRSVWMILLAFALMPCSVSLAQPSSEELQHCRLPDELQGESFALSKAAAQAAKGQLNVLVVVPGRPWAGRELKVQPWFERLEPALQDALRATHPALTLALSRIEIPRAGFVNAGTTIVREAKQRQASLVLWQLGRAYASLASPGDFGQALDRAVLATTRAGVDMMLITPPYHPRSEVLFNTAEHRHQVHWVGGRRNLMVFPRFEWTEYAASSGGMPFDDEDAERNRAPNEWVHRCLAQGLAGSIREGIDAVR